MLLEVFTEAINDSRVSDQIEDQLKTQVLEGERFGQLHNNIRYPRYMWRSGDFSVLQLTNGDVQKVLKKLERLKSFVAGFAKLKGETSPLAAHVAQRCSTESEKAGGTENRGSERESGAATG